jgi:hypothetical protein
MRNLLAALATLMLSSCQTWVTPWSEVTGERWKVPSLESNTAPTTVNLIDGAGSFQKVPDTGAIKLEPGPHVLVLAAAPLPAGWTGGTDPQTVRIDFEPCRRFYVNARYDTPLGRSWKPIINFVEPIAGCALPATPN